jgi:hypothetical protein
MQCVRKRSWGCATILRYEHAEALGRRGMYLRHSQMDVWAGTCLEVSSPMNGWVASPKKDKSEFFFSALSSRLRARLAVTDCALPGCGKTLERELNEKSAVVPRLDMNESQRS